MRAEKEKRASLGRGQSPYGQKQTAPKRTPNITSYAAGVETRLSQKSASSANRSMPLSRIGEKPQGSLIERQTAGESNNVDSKIEKLQSLL